MTAITKPTVLITGCSEESHDDVEILPLDVTSASSITSCVDAVEKRTGGRLDVLVNNAGAMFSMPLLDTDIDQSKKLFEVNVWGVLARVYNTSKAATRWLSETLRIGMKGLGVRVVTAMIGEVNTKIYANGLAGTGVMQREAEEPDVTAENLVRDVLSGRDGHVWHGGVVAGRAKYFHWTLPERFFEWMLLATRGVYQIKPPQQP
ncbi:hypothetical protein GGS23DRAFT_608381 [Durotheca rogersii]|uniref:uncharacterized protein n=1 Tax=Durotheca rogersii TaxID=419775 RepID=UPI00221E9B7A|nr:uncharacterized protein GGS23DRAFT_608381 [Durotheca rogersii]KAI5853648.1 hypothetical protein GGS23DRAFT_608381 [Durotheca rogersii]